MKNSNVIVFGHNSGDGIPQTNIGSFNLFDIWMSDLSHRSSSWNYTEKSESENLEGDSVFKYAGCENNFEVEKVGRRICLVLNHADSNHISTGLNHVDSNHAD